MLINTSKFNLLEWIKKTQQDDVEIKKIVDLAEARKIDGYITRSGIFLKEVDCGLSYPLKTITPY